MQMSCLTGPTYCCFLHSNILTSTVPLAVRMLHHKYQSKQGNRSLSLKRYFWNRVSNWQFLLNRMILIPYSVGNTLMSVAPNTAQLLTQHSSLIISLHHLVKQQTSYRTWITPPTFLCTQTVPKLRGQRPKLNRWTVPILPQFQTQLLRCLS